MHGLGVDVVEIARIEQAVTRWGDRFLDRIFTADELAYCQARGRPGQSLAVRFAAKEAFAKAVEQDVRPTWREVEVAMAPGGKPFFTLSPRLATLLADHRVRLSLSHSQTIAIAAVVVDSP